MLRTDSFVAKIGLECNQICDLELPIYIYDFKNRIVLHLQFETYD